MNAVNIEKFLARRATGVSASGIRRIFDLAATMKDPIDFSMGQPDFPVPDRVKEQAARAIMDNRNGYTVTHGINELRDAIRARITAEFDWQPDILVTCGVSGGLTLVMMSCLDPGDQAIIIDPYFVSYPHLIRLAGGEPIVINAAPTFELPLDAIERAVTDRTKLILVNSPNNPTGVVQNREAIEALCAIARKHDLLIVSDEIYDQLCFDGPATAPATFAPERTMVLRGFGKTYGMTGWRMGYAAGPAAIIREMAKLQQFTFVCAPHPFQLACIEALDTDMGDVVASYRAKRELAVELLAERFEFPKPAGGFFVYCRAPDGFESGTQFVEAAIKRNVLTVPGAAFSDHDTHFRISYAVDNERLRAGCQVLCDLAG